MRRDRRGGQLQVLESILVALFLFVAILVVSIYRLPSNPGVFQHAELQRLAEDALKVRAAKSVSAGADCNETPCPFSNDLERMLSLALGYVGTVDSGGSPDPEAPTDSELRSFLDQALPKGTRYIFHYSNGYNLTKLFPLDLTPPTTGVVVARNLQLPNWAVQNSESVPNVFLRIGEKTTFAPALDTTPTLKNIYDPQNRTMNEWGTVTNDNTHLLQERVPPNAVLGTYLACFSAFCTRFVVVPNGVHASGAKILAENRPHAVQLAEKGTWSTYLKYVEADGTGDYSKGDTLYLDSDGDPAGGPGSVSAADLRLSAGLCVPPPATLCQPGSYVYAGQADEGEVLNPLPPALTLQWHEVAGAGYSEEDTVYLSDSAQTTVEADARRLARVGLYAAGGAVRAGEADVGHAYAANFGAAKVFFDDLDGDTNIDIGEPVYLDLEGDGLEINDLHLSRVGNWGHRHFIDIKLVVWFGV